MTTGRPVSATFLKSSSKWSGCPKPDLPEYAFVGRSNVGKSSMINLLTGRKNLAKTSGKPGKTQLINHFSIATPGENTLPGWYLVDLPGYGYAKVSKSLRAEFQSLIFPYLQHRENLMCTFVLIDIRHEPQPIDLEFMEKLGVRGIPFVMVFTKADKLKPATVPSQIAQYNTVMLASWEELPRQFITSSETGAGREEILEFIDETNKLYRSS